ncbi:MAG: hypothetical protein H6621_00065 [Halobacteriovoraceae bacterium]|nr:hypothetical protein [Halobacteriovoraceae bacterium]MCB9093434.1 hypothetical protein [Halobacteriovoraceae bacterium]
MEQNQKPETLLLGWLDPRNEKVTHAGVAFYNEKFGEYLLKIDEEPSEKQYFLKPFGSESDSVTYRMELVIKRRDGKFLKRQCVGEGYSSEETSGNVFVNYGSKFKTLVLYIKD